MCISVRWVLLTDSSMHIINNKHHLYLFNAHTYGLFIAFYCYYS